MFLSLVIFVLNIFCSVTSDVNSTLNDDIVLKFATDCTTPNKDSGFCLSIDDCPNLSKVKNVEEHGEFIKQSNCSSNNDFFNVCCGKHNNFLNKLHRNQTKTNVVMKGIKDDPFPKECGRQIISIYNRIFGGRETVLGEFPWMVRLRHRSKSGRKNFGCVGFLIAPKYVITAAHCILSQKLIPWGPITHVLLGEHDTQEAIDCEQGNLDLLCADPPQLIRIGKPILHRQYVNSSRSQHHDIAIIPLRWPANFTKYVQPICLAKKPLEETEMWLAGWGRTEYDLNSAKKLKVAINRRSMTYCKLKYKTHGIDIVSSQICAGGEENKDSCSGDSGGPLMVHHGSGSGQWYAEGVVSFGLACGLDYWPGVYTSIPYYHSWIEKKVRRHHKHKLNKTKKKQQKLKFLS